MRVQRMGTLALAVCIAGCVPDTREGVGGSTTTTGSGGSTGACDATHSTMLAPSDGVGNAAFGSSVALDGATALIGAPGTGIVYVYVWDGAAWSEQAKLIPNDGQGAGVGWSVALSGDTALLGTATGAAYVFVRSGSAWTEQAKLTPISAEQMVQFGRSVALHEDTAIVGDFQRTVAGQANVGAAYVFVRNGTTWAQEAELTGADIAATGWFGFGVSVSGDSALVGAPLHLGGHVYAFRRSGGTWSQEAKLTPGPAGMVGYAVSLSGSTALIGAPKQQVGAVATAGAAYVYTRSGTTWTKQAQLLASDPSEDAQFGGALSTDGATMLVGHSNHDAAYVFVKTGNGWIQESLLVGCDTAVGDRFGIGVSVSGANHLVGANFHEVTLVHTGSAYMFSKAWQ